ncbi:MAG TPA: DUF2278 family protein [Paracoccaceae bacterium]|nr:DUF2278 family protein [Paracoccaceae bacterium]
MPLSEYGLWVARPVRVSAERAAEDPTSPHIHLFYDDGGGGAFGGARRASINVKSQSRISELVYWHTPDFRHPLTSHLPGLAPGFRRIESRPGDLALDYLRGNLVDFARGRILPHDVAGAPNDIIDFVMPELQAAIHRGATAYLFGEPYDDHQGIHDIHMNQGSAAQFARYNGVWQDGAVILHYPFENRFAALFFAFASQAVHTDERSGHALAGSQTFAELLGEAVEPGRVPPIAEDRRVAIVAALINPVGSENMPDSIGQPETVYLLNRSGQGISLAGWSILNRMDEAHVLSGDVWLAAGEMCGVTLGQVALSNQGGVISLLDPEGIKVDGVSYTAADAAEEGRLVLFR